MKKKYMIMIVLCILASFVVLVSVNYYKMDLNKFHYDELARVAVSPDEKYMIQVSILGERDERHGDKNDLYYSCASLIEIINSTPTTTGKSKVIYFKKDCTDAEVQWLDSQTVIINGVKLNILKDTYKRY